VQPLIERSDATAPPRSRKNVSALRAGDQP
jgi:hypothetical protein